jgi:hypothetical protein
VNISVSIAKGRSALELLPLLPELLPEELPPEDEELEPLLLLL